MRYKQHYRAWSEAIGALTETIKESRMDCFGGIKIYSIDSFSFKLKAPSPVIILPWTKIILESNYFNTKYEKVDPFNAIILAQYNNVNIVMFIFPKA